MAAALTKYNLTGWFKERYADAPAKVMGRYTQLKKEFAFEKRNKTGDFYHQAVQLTRPGGFTYPSANATEYTSLNTPVAMTIGDAKLQGSELIARQWLTYKQLENSLNTTDSFGSSMDLAVNAIMDEIDRLREIDILDGGKELALTTTGAAGTTSLLETVTISTRTWSTARWFGTEGKKIAFYNSTSLVSSSTDAIYTIVSINNTNKTMSVSGTATGIAALHTALTGTGNTLGIYWYGAYGNRMQGLNAISTATSTLFNIDASAYTAWQGQTYTLGTATTFTKQDLFKICALASDKGATGEMVVVLPTCGMASLLEALSDLQQFLEKRGGAAYEIGADGIKVVTPNAGIARMISHPLCRDGEGYLFPAKVGIRVGATEFTWGRPGGAGEEKMIFDIDDKDVVEVRAYNDEALYIPPTQCVKILSAATTATL